MATNTVGKQPVASSTERRWGNQGTSWEVLGRSIINIVLALWAVIVIFPMLWLLYTSFKTDQEIFFSPWSLPATLAWDNFSRAWVSAHIGDYFLNSLLVVIPSLFLTLLLFRATRCFLLLSLAFGRFSRSLCLAIGLGLARCFCLARRGLS